MPRTTRLMTSTRSSTRSSPSRFRRRRRRGRRLRIRRGIRVLALAGLLAVPGRLRFSRLLLRVVGDVPPGPLELDGGRRRQLPHRAAALRAGGHQGVGELLDPLEAVRAGVAFVFVERHGVPVPGRPGSAQHTIVATRRRRRQTTLELTAAVKRRGPAAASLDHGAFADHQRPVHP